MTSNISRFDRVVEDYENYRPSYPKELIEIFKKEIGFRTADIVADIGSGTGISSSLFIENMNVVYGIEPNSKMRSTAASKFENELHFKTVNGTAEATTLKDQSIDLIFCGQAFHWFDARKAKREFQRILKPRGHIVIAWNERDLKSDFQIAYDEMLRRNIEDYNKRREIQNLEQKVVSFFETFKLYQTIIPQSQLYDLASLEGRLRSSSFCPANHIDGYKQLFSELEQLFYCFEENGLIRFDYLTQVFIV